MDIEWGKDGTDGKLYVLQARPETVKAGEKLDTLRRYRLKQRSEVLATGRAIGQKIGSGPVRVVKTAAEMSSVRDGEVLVTDMTDPDWEPVMKRTAAIVTNRGGRTCHAAIIARELGIPAVVGCGDATQVLKDGRPVTVSCAEGDTGFVYRGALETEVIDLSLSSMPKSPVKITMNVGNPELAFEFQRLPNEGVGLARLEFIIARMIGVHPRAVLFRPGDLLRRQAGGRRGHAGRGVLAQAGNRAPVRLQVERILEPDRRLALRAAGGESHARLPRRGTLHRPFIP
jgi:pyruvate,water dikinase